MNWRHDGPEHLCCKHKALSSNPNSLTKTTKEKIPQTGVKAYKFIKYKKERKSQEGNHPSSKLYRNLHTYPFL
jgi:hypothetical protein